MPVLSEKRMRRDKSTWRFIKATTVPLNKDASHSKKIINATVKNEARKDVVAFDDVVSGDTIRVLCLDGGGTRGVIEARFLEEIERKTGKPINELFDFIAGTSIGGILALGLAYKNPKLRRAYTAKEMKGIFYEDGHRIFDQSWGPLRGAWQVWSPKYDSKGIEGVLKNKFGNAKMRDIDMPVLVTSYNVTESQSSTFLSSAPRSKDLYLRDVGRATSAAPTFFPSLQLARPGEKDRKIYVDGAFAANNPSIIATIAAIFLFKTTKVFVVSLGVGFSSSKQNVDTRGGYSVWAPRVFSSTSASNAHVTHRCMEFLSNHLDGDNKAPVIVELDKTGLKKLKSLSYMRFNVDLTPTNGDDHSKKKKDLSKTKDGPSNMFINFFKERFKKEEKDLSLTIDDPSEKFLNALVKKVEDRYFNVNAPQRPHQKFNRMVHTLEAIARKRTPAEARKIKGAKWDIAPDPNVYWDEDEDPDQ
mmetsp:Transcript_35885/g.58002  ORF Transcript_35885/g.58002 Transcript_35885/m.58002 type:complete len:473 (-) Transcript_35885:412-1830(-)|eukprot:CAMPEP_0184664118 /NCGR_PEP_ID=MMETSP0308-20130426/51335_1 /TAXON_ID=38269 /ORGANISM="Gloeochaete witrockiana, Strain SAG 46.84" /LENGTH=472 /DNA_ID=CAMNT_0027107301 /DNA_START=44 /DNA_END=1462 /DNA_ORIENTATION=+